MNGPIWFVYNTFAKRRQTLFTGLYAQTLCMLKLCLRVGMLKLYLQVCSTESTHSRCQCKACALLSYYTRGDGCKCKMCIYKYFILKVFAKKTFISTLHSFSYQNNPLLLTSILNPILNTFSIWQSKHYCNLSLLSKELSVSQNTVAKLSPSMAIVSFIVDVSVLPQSLPLTNPPIRKYCCLLHWSCTNIISL